MVLLRPELEAVQKFMLVLVLFNLTAASACFAISIVFSDQGVATLLATLLMLFEMLVRKLWLVLELCFLFS